MLTVSNITSQNIAVGNLYLAPGQSVVVGFLTAAIQAAITGGQLSSSGTAAETVPQTSVTLLNTTGGVVSVTNTIVVSPATYTPATDEANNATLLTQINNCINDIAALGNIMNSITTAGNLNVKVQ